MTNIILNNKKIEINAEQEQKIKELLGVKSKLLSEVEIGETFEIGGYEFIKFTEHNGKCAVVCKDTVFDSVFDDRHNNLAKSKLLKKLTKEFLPKIEQTIGADNVCEFETDLCSLDGSKGYGTFISKISIPTFDFFRNNSIIFKKYKLDKGWWLATPWSTPGFIDTTLVVCISSLGFISDGNCRYDNCGVRAFLILKSSTFVS